MRRIAIALSIAVSSCAAPSPATTATSYERERVRGDVAKARIYLSAADEAMLNSGAAKAEDADLGTTGIPSTTVDSAHVLYDDGDSARVAVYMTGPNFRQGLISLLPGILTGQQLDSAELRRALRTVPRVTSADTVALTKADAGWRVSAGLPYHRALRDSLTTDLRVEHVYINSFLRGKVWNRSAAKFEALTLEVFDAKGESRLAEVGELAPHGSVTLLDETTLAPGRPTKVLVRSLEISKAPFHR